LILERHFPPLVEQHRDIVGPNDNESYAAVGLHFATANILRFIIALVTLLSTGTGVGYGTGNNSSDHCQTVESNRILCFSLNSHALSRVGVISPLSLSA